MATKNQKQPKPPILPRSPSDPVGLAALEQSAVDEFARRVKRCVKVYRNALDSVPRVLQVNAVYTFQLEASLLTTLLAQADMEVDEILLEGGRENLWFMTRYVEVGAARGVAQAFANLAQQSPAYKAGRQSASTIISSDPFRQRMTLLRAREFEEMKGLTGPIKADMSRVLTEGIGRGLNPLEIGRQLEAQGIVERSRANRIARTEIGSALRRARLDEADDAEELYGVRSKEMQISALSPTTRKTHAERHGTLHTRDEMRGWWAKDGNSINCKCNTVAVLVDSKGEPLVPALEQRARATLAKLKARGEGPWTKD